MISTNELTRAIQVANPTAPTFDEWYETEIATDPRVGKGGEIEHVAFQALYRNMFHPDWR